MPGAGAVLAGADRGTARRAAADAGSLEIEADAEPRDRTPPWRSGEIVDGAVRSLDGAVRFG